MMELLFVVGLLGLVGVVYLLSTIYSYYKLLPATTDPAPKVIESEGSITVEYYKGGLEYLIVVPKEQPSSLHCVFFGILKDHPTRKLRFPQHTVNRASVKVLGFERVEMRNQLGKLIASFAGDEIPNPYPLKIE